MVGRILDENEHVIDSNTGKAHRKRKDHLGKYQTSGMYPRVVVRACNKNFAQHLLSYPLTTNRAKRNLGRLRYSYQRAPEQSINTSWIHGILKLYSIPFGVPSCHHWDRGFRTIIGAYNSYIGSRTPTNSRKQKEFRSEIMALRPEVTIIKSNKL